MITVRLRVLAAAASISEHSGARGTHDYRFKLTGYDDDGSSWLGTLSLDSSPDTSMSRRDYQHIKESPITIERVASTVMFITAGIDDIAWAILSGITASNDPAITRYNELKRSDGGASLSTDEMEAVASYLLKKTSLRHREVGGENQIAVLQRGVQIKLIQSPFTGPSTRSSHCYRL